jgi:hypothetical protein
MNSETNGNSLPSPETKASQLKIDLERLFSPELSEVTEITQKLIFPLGKETYRFFRPNTAGIVVQTAIEGFHTGFGSDTVFIFERRQATENSLVIYMYFQKDSFIKKNSTNEWVACKKLNLLKLSKLRLVIYLKILL